MSPPVRPRRTKAVLSLAGLISDSNISGCGQRYASAARGAVHGHDDRLGNLPHTHDQPGEPLLGPVTPLCAVGRLRPHIQAVIEVDSSRRTRARRR